MILEDEFLIALDIKSTAEELGYEVVCLAGSEDRALAALEREQIDI